MKRLPLLVCLALLSSMVGTGAVQAHSADTFTVVIKESGLMPGSSQITYNDSVVWHNTDGRENITHRIVFDFDGDGLFNGTDDWDSGELVADCNTTSSENETGSTNESECNITFMVWFNGTWGIGEYNYQNMISDGPYATAPSLWLKTCTWKIPRRPTLEARLVRLKTEQTTWTMPRERKTMKRSGCSS